MNAAVQSMSAAEKRSALREMLRGRRMAPRLLSFAQERLYFIDQLIPGVPLYNIPAVVPINAFIDANILDRALQEIVRRHDVLRTSFRSIDGRPLAFVHPELEMILDVDDLSRLSPTKQQDQLADLIGGDARLTFNLEQPPLAHARLVRISGERSYLLWTIHHIISDAASSAIFFDELSQLYEAFARNRPSPLPALPLQYFDFAEWQREQLRGERMQQLLQYWSARLANALDAELPSDRPRPRQPTYRGGLFTSAATLPTAALMRTCEKLNATMPMMLYAAFACLLHRCSGSPDVIIGSPVANRSRTDTERLIGFFVNTLPIRIDLRGDPFFGELVARVREEMLGAYDHQDLPLERLVEHLQPARSNAANPLFQVMLVFQIAGPASHGHLGSSPAGWGAARPGNGTSKFDLTLFAFHNGSELSFGWEYSCDLFDEPTVQRLAAQYRAILTQAGEQPASKVSDFLLLSAEEHAGWLANATGATVRVRSRSVHAMVERRAAETPEAVAVIEGEVALTYAALNAMANRLTARLEAARVLSGDPVGVFMAAGWKAAVAILGILKHGSPYVPLDVSYPEPRIRFMIENSGLRTLVADNDTDLPVQTIKFDSHALSIYSPDTPAEPDSIADRLVYIMYTSGSTGAPKGVCMPHRALANLIEWQISSEGRSRRTLQFAPLSFDVSFQEMFTTWAAGGALVIPESALRRDFPRLWRFIVETAIQRLFLPYVALQALCEAAVASGIAAPSLETVITAGEQLLITPAIRTVFSRLTPAGLRNQYGPTETHVVTEQLLRGDPALWPDRPAIGRPIANARVFILDQYRQPAPAGIPGEIYIGGAALASGYRNDPELTRERFSGLGTDGRLYCTGDRGRFRTDGAIDFLGRSDEQTKIRGFRVEPEEVRLVLLLHPEVAEAAVGVRKTGTGDSRLIAYVTPRTPHSFAPAELRRWCMGRLPEHMTPSEIVAVEAMPLTSSGKIDLRRMDTATRLAISGPSADSLAPMTPTEAALIHLMREVLDNIEVPLDGDFFALGGHSLIAMRLLGRVRTRFGVQLPMQALFDHSSVRAFAAQIDACQNPAEAAGTR